MFTKNNYDALVKLEGNLTADNNAIDRRLIDKKIINSSCQRNVVEDVNMRLKKIILREIGQSLCTTISVKYVDRVPCKKNKADEKFFWLIQLLYNLYTIHYEK